MSNLKTGLEYFSLNTDIELDDKITLIEAKHGAVGFTVIIKLWVKIYGDKGYYYDWNERTNLIFSKRANLDYEKVKEVVEDAIEFDLFDKKMFKKYGILTSKKIQENYLHATKRRNSVEIKRAFLLLNGSNVDIKGENVNIIDENDDILPHSIVKDSIVKDNTLSSKGKIPYSDIVDYLNKKADKNFKHDTKQTRSLIKARYNESFTLDDFKKVIDIKCQQWKTNPDMMSYLRPQTLFGTKFESYLNERNGGGKEIKYL